MPRQFVLAYVFASGVLSVQIRVESMVFGSRQGM